MRVQSISSNALLIKINQKTSMGYNAINLSTTQSSAKVLKSNLAITPSFGKDEVIISHNYDDLKKQGEASGWPYDISRGGYDKSYGQVYYLNIHKKTNESVLGYNLQELEQQGRESGRSYHIERAGYEKSYGQVYYLYYDD